MKKAKNYNIGLDIGVGSVGWCVTDCDNNILKRNSKNMWGARIFDEANTAKERRTFRSSKRRLNRRKERINILQSLMQDDIEKEYLNFLPLLRETSNIAEDKNIIQSMNGVKYNLFAEDELTDSAYYGYFPTIYHLRKYLIETTEKVDIRLVYLAIHHIIKYRGNFLYEGDLSKSTTEVSEKIDIILEYLKENCDIILNKDKDEILNILQQKDISKADKKDKLITYFDFDKESKQIIINVINSFLGYTFDLSKVFEIEIEKNKISFASELENEDEILEILNEKAEIYEAMKTVYSWFILQDILKGKEYISDAFIDKYDKYAKDLKLLKKVYKDYFPNEYKDMFKKEGTNNYVAYNGKSLGKNFKKCNPEDFIKKLEEKIKILPDDCEEKQTILDSIKNDEFLKKINVTENGAIPHQLHSKELEKILENQSKYYKTLEKNKENIMKLFSFRIPYYVGPLAKENGKWSWVIRKNDEHIRPWNFDEVVDEDATAEKFIKRMTNKCTYILNEDVIPKQSLLYSKFCVLNELNNLRIDGNRISKDMKKLIIDKLFKTRKKVTVKMIKDLYNHEGFKIDNITGLSDGNNFNSNMISYIDMVKIFGKVDESNFEQCEKLIYWITIFEEKKILKRKIKKEYPELTDNQLKELVKLKYSGWSRLSKRLLIGLKSYDNETIMEKLEKTSMNFMQVINQKEFGFDKQLENLMPKISNKITYKDVDDMPTSPANKRAIWQSICVVKEIVKVMKCEPQNIYIEFARNEEIKKMKDTKTKQLLKKYDEIENQLKELKLYDNKVYKELKKHQDDKNITEKMYLYFIQNGKCLYSGKPLNIDELDKYEVDHIRPQSYIKDDSIDNKALVIREENQKKKDSLLLSDEIIDRQNIWWKSLLDNGLISQTKYYRLIKRKMFETDDEREKFVQRQLVETRQITKYVTNLLISEYENSQVFAIRAQLTHDFREKYKFYKNRNINNYHHAQDAYILNVVGNILIQNWKGTEQFKYSDYVKRYFKDEKNLREKNGMLIGFIGKYVDIEKARKIMNYKDCFVSRMLQENTGAFYDQTLYSPNDNKVKPVIPLKNTKSPEKYGGYSGEKKAYCTIFGYKDKKGKQQYQLVGIPVQIAYKIKDKFENIENYIRTTILKDVQYTDFEIIREKILKNQQYLDNNDEPMRLCSDTEIRPDKELVVNEKINKFVYLMNLNEDKLNDEEKELVENNYENVFDYLLEKLENEYKIFESTTKKLQENKIKFSDLENVNKRATINGLIDLMETGQGNLKSIGLADREGRRAGQTFKTDKLLNMIFIDKSVTGMYERRYKINGVENCSSK